jgi:hypothetical protein
VSTHYVEQTVVLIEGGVPWWMRRLPWRWKVRLLKGRPLRGEAMMRCNDERHWRKVAFAAGTLGGHQTSRFSCPKCGEMLPGVVRSPGEGEE